MTGTAIAFPNEMKIVMIPAKSQEEIKKAAKCLKVAAYCRVSTDDKEQKTSYEAQIQYYTDKINKNPEWQMAGIFADEGITGTQAKKRPEFLKMIRLGRQGKIDVILTKSLSELLVCGECGTHYRRVTWTAKGFKEIKWRCINRIQYGKKKCHNSPTLDEQALHRTIVSAINEFCEVKDDVAKALRESITEELDPNLNGSVQAAQQRIDELAHNIDELIKLATVPETAATAMADI